MTSAWSAGGDQAIIDALVDLLLERGGEGEVRRRAALRDQRIGRPAVDATTEGFLVKDA